MEEGKIVYLKLSELHPFHTFREYTYKVQDDRAMDDLVDTIKVVHGVMTPATAATTAANGLDWTRCPVSSGI